MTKQSDNDKHFSDFHKQIFISSFLDGEITPADQSDDEGKQRTYIHKHTFSSSFRW